MLEHVETRDWPWEFSSISRHLKQGLSLNSELIDSAPYQDKRGLSLATLVQLETGEHRGHHESFLLGNKPSLPSSWVALLL